MGSEAHVFVFDHGLYVSEIAPALRNLLLTGTLTPRLANVAAKLEELGYDPLPSYGGADLARDCTHLHVLDLAYQAASFAEAMENRACQSRTCPSRSSCPLHRDSTASSTEAFTLFAVEVIERSCLGESQFVGRNWHVDRYGDALTRGIAEIPVLGDFMTALGTRGRVIGCYGQIEGVHGWLDPSETHALHGLLSALDLPRYEPSFAAMRAFLGGPMPRYEPPPDYSFEDLSLSFVRTVARIAAARGRGILWGNDLMAGGNDF